MQRDTSHFQKLCHFQTLITLLKDFYLSVSSAINNGWSGNARSLDYASFRVVRSVGRPESTHPRSVFQSIPFWNKEPSQTQETKAVS
jgi:hypothetical protein